MKNTRDSILSYTVGFVLSVALTVAAFWVAAYFGAVAVPMIIGLALIQLLVQFKFFLHIGGDSSPRADAFVLLFTLVIIGIVIGGTLWIMGNLARLHVHPMTTDELYEGGVVSPEHELH